MTLAVAVPPGREPERAYAVGVVLGTFLGLEHRLAVAPGEDVRIAAGDGRDGPALLVADGLLRAPDADWLAPASLPAGPLARVDPAPELGEPWPAGPLPVPFGDAARGGPLLEPVPDGLRLRVDVFGSAFFMLTRYEELVRPERDEHGRFPVAASVAAREGFLHRPLVDELADLLWAALRRLWPGLRRAPRRRRVILTHDVDWPLVTLGRSRAQVARSAAGDLVRRRAPGVALRRLRAHGRVRRGRLDADPGDTFDFIMDTSERHGLASAFYVMAGHTSPAHDGAYSLDHPWIRALLRRIRRRGHRLGLHPSYATWRDPGRVRAELHALAAAAEEEGVGQDAWGARQHFLRWENPATWRAYEEAGLAYDTTLGHPERPGFRCGACTEYPAFDLRGRRRLAVVERPLVAMDVSLTLHMGLSLEEAGRRVLALDAACRRHGGDLVLLWHNDQLMTRNQRYRYRELVAALVD
jgi:hypothetical protein